MYKSVQPLLMGLVLLVMAPLITSALFNVGTGNNVSSDFSLIYWIIPYFLLLGGIFFYLGKSNPKVMYTVLLFIHLVGLAVFVYLTLVLQVTVMSASTLIIISFFFLAISSGFLVIVINYDSFERDV